MNNLAETYILKGEWTNALGVYQSLVQHDPDNLDWVRMLELVRAIVDPTLAK
jgi:hypothetical protein